MDIDDLRMLSALREDQRNVFGISKSGFSLGTRLVALRYYSSLFLQGTQQGSDDSELIAFQFRGVLYMLKNKLELHKP